MPDIQKAVEGLQSGADVLFILMGAVIVLAMHGGFAFLEAGTVRRKNQVNALCKILVDFTVSTVAYFFIGYTIAYGVAFFVNAEALNGAAKGSDPAGADARQILLPVHFRQPQEEDLTSVSPCGIEAFRRTVERLGIDEEGDAVGDGVADEEIGTARRYGEIDQDLAVSALTWFLWRTVPASRNAKPPCMANGEHRAHHGQPL